MERQMVSLKRSARRFAQLFLLWTAVVFLFATQWYSYDALHGHPGPVFTYIRWNMEQWYVWLLLSPLVLRLAAKRPIDPRHPLRALPLHLLASGFFALLAVFLQSAIGLCFEPGSPHHLGSSFLFLLSKDVAMGVVTYWALTGLAQTLHFYKENSNRQVRESELERQLAQAQLQVLQMQLHPHFLFNTLHAIGTLIYEDPASAEKMLLDLSSLLRVFLEHESSQQISLRRELHLVDLYLSIQRIRFRDRLTIRSRIEPETLDCSIPSLILQPLVENAIVHGIAKNPDDDTIEITGSREADQLIVEISNSNSSLPDEVGLDHDGWGVGLSNTVQRLTQIYNGSANLSLRALSPRGVVCRVSIPFAESTSTVSSQEELLAL
jgi:two-component system, LytTR family, sensor kinase